MYSKIKLENMIFINEIIFFLFTLVYFVDLSSAMTLINSCQSDNDCPPSWDKNAIFCNIPITNNVSLSKRNENEVVVYDGSQTVNVDENKPETLSHSVYKSVCVAYRPMGYKCQKRSDCLANKKVDLPYIQCINNVCTDLGKTTGNYMKTAKGNHKFKGSKYWYIGLGLSIVALILFLGCSAIIINNKSKKMARQKMEEKIKKENEHDINAYEEEDKTTVTFVNDNDNSNGSSEVIIINETDDGYPTKPHKKIINDESKNTEKDKKKSKRSLFNRLTLGLLGRHTTDSTTTSNISSIEKVDADATLGRHTHQQKMKVKSNNKNDMEEIDLTNSLREKDMDTIYDTDSISYDKIRMQSEIIAGGKNGKPSLKYKSSIDPERTLVRNLRKKSSRATVRTSATMKTLDSGRSMTTSDYDKTTIINTVDMDDYSILHRSSTKYSKASSLSTNIGLNDEDNERVFMDSHKTSTLGRSKYAPFTLSSLSREIEGNKNENEQGIIYSDNVSEKNINNSMLKRFSDGVEEGNDDKYIAHSCSSDAIKLNDSSQLKSYYQKNEYNEDASSFDNEENRYHKVISGTKNNNTERNQKSIVPNKTVKNIYPTPKQNPNTIIQMNGHPSGQAVNNENIRTPKISPEQTADVTNKSTPSSYSSNSNDYFNSSINTNNENQIQNQEHQMILPSLSMPLQLPISEIVESSFGDSSNSSIISNDSHGLNKNRISIESNEGMDTIQYSQMKNYSIPTPFDSPRLMANNNNNDSSKRMSNRISYNSTTSSYQQSPSPLYGNNLAIDSNPSISSNGSNNPFINLMRNQNEAISPALRNEIIQSLQSSHNFAYKQQQNKEN